MSLDLYLSTLKANGPKPVMVNCVFCASVQLIVRLFHTALYSTYEARHNNGFDMQIWREVSWHDCSLVRFRKKIKNAQ